MFTEIILTELSISADELKIILFSYLQHIALD